MDNLQTIDTVWDDVFGTEHKLPMHWEICEECEGEGYTSRIPGAITSATMDDWYGDDQEGRDDFVQEYTKRGGMYDQECLTCKGAGKVKAPDESKMSDSLKVLLAETRQDLADCNAMERSERMMGA